MNERYCKGPGNEEVGVAQVCRVLLISYIALDLLFIQDPLCQIRLVIKIKSTGKSVELEGFGKWPCCLKFATPANNCYGSIALFLFPLKDRI